ncbi:MAG: hypothetical protein C4581_12105 [Nitrospiraceae bacterium]|nr:MAG: hypothetical protein C4581_12105 [Nitrospiraceae bacterium]
MCSLDYRRCSILNKYVLLFNIKPGLKPGHQQALRFRGAVVRGVMKESERPALFLPEAGPGSKTR